MKGKRVLLFVFLTLSFAAIGCDRKKTSRSSPPNKPSAPTFLEEQRINCKQDAQTHPDDPQSWCHLGEMLANEAIMAEGAAADELYARAYSHFEYAVALEPKMGHAWHAWGTALKKQACDKQGEQADNLFAQAYEKYQRAAVILTEDSAPLINWGLTLKIQACRKEGKQRRDLLKQAEATLLQAEEREPEFAAYGLACVYALTGDEVQCRKKLQAGQKYNTLPTREIAYQQKDLAGMRDKAWFKTIRWINDR